MNPKISIIIPCYKYADYLDECMKSVLEQDYDNYEIIIINDGSPDNTDEVVKKYLDNPKVKYVKQNNRGLPSARNTGIMNATGEWILPLDADDKISPVYLTRISDVIKDIPDVDVIYCDLQHYGTRDDKVRLKRESWGKEELKQYNPLAYCSAIRKTCLLECGGYNVKYIKGWEDYAMWVELFSRNKKFIHIPEAHFFYHKHGFSMIDTSFSPDAVEFSMGLMKKYYPDIFDV